jgi:hypothetical protein
MQPLPRQQSPIIVLPYQGYAGMTEDLPIRQIVLVILDGKTKLITYEQELPLQ